MYIDAQGKFSDGQALTASAVSSNVVDLGGDYNLGIGEPMAVVLVVDAAADGTDGNETYEAKIQFSSDEAFTSPVDSSSKFVPAGSAAGSKFVLPVSPDQSGDRYMRLSYELGGTTPAVTFSAFLIPQNMVDNYVQYADAITIS